MYIPSCLSLLGHIPSGDSSSSSGNSSGSSSINNSGSSGSSTISINNNNNTTPNTANYPNNTFCKCVSKVRQRSLTYVQWPEDWKVSVHPVSFTTLNLDTIQKIRVHNKTNKTTNSTKKTNSNANNTVTSNNDHSKLDVDVDVDMDIYALKYSTLFMRKMKPENEEEFKDLYRDWVKYVYKYSNNVNDISKKRKLKDLDFE